MWKSERRLAADRRGLRYPSDLNGVEWSIVEPMIQSAERGDCECTIDVREILNGIFYVLLTGCQWLAISSVNEVFGRRFRRDWCRQEAPTDQR